MKKQAIITGAYGAIGKAIAKGLAEKDYAVILVGRNSGKLEDVCSEISAQTGNKDVIPACIDLSSEQEIKTFASGLKKDIALLVNNAATTPPQRKETPEGIEMQWAVNVLGYVWMMRYVQPLMPPKSRIVNVASYWAGGLDLNDVEFSKRPYDNDTAYRQSKQADRMLSAFFAKKIKPNNITVNSCHPGDVNSKLSNSMGFGGHETPSQGAATPLWLAMSPDVEGITGQYFEHRQQVNCQFSQNSINNLALFDLCMKYIR